MVWVCLVVYHVSVIIATSILRSVHTPMTDSVLLHIDLIHKDIFQYWSYGYYFVAELVYIVGVNSILDLLVN